MAIADRQLEYTLVSRWQWPNLEQEEVVIYCPLIEALPQISVASSELIPKAQPFFAMSTSSSHEQG